MRRLPLLLLPLAAACAGDERSSTALAAAAPPAAPPAVEEPVRPELPPGDPAVAALDRYLALSLADAPDSVATPAALAALLGCDMPFEPELPAELLAAYAISGLGRRGDTTIVRARVLTVAEQDRGRADPGRLTASQRVRQGEWEWDLVEQDGAWRVCTGPRFGFVGDPAETAWRTEGASLQTARELAASVRAERRP